MAMSTEIRHIVESLAEKYLDWWKPTSDGKNINGPCPFHHEKTAGAFYMSTDNGLFICHSCHAKGTLHKFLQDIGAPARVRVSVQDQVGKLLVKTSKHELNIIREDPFRNHMALKESLLGIFDYCPVQLLEAGFDKKVLKQYDVGFDKAAMRITFPLRNHLGVLMGVAGRTVTGEQPRYLIYKANEYVRLAGKTTEAEKRYRHYDFNKKNFLWNMDRVYPEAFHGELDHVFVVEGYKAALWLIQHGAWNTVALQGTYLSMMQQRLLQRLAADIYMFLDNTDHAEKGVHEAGMRLAKSHRVKVCIYPSECEDGAQPDDLKTEQLLETLRTAENFNQWRLQYERNLRSKGARAAQLRP